MNAREVHFSTLCLDLQKTIISYFGLRETIGLISLRNPEIYKESHNPLRCKLDDVLETHMLLFLQSSTVLLRVPDTPPEYANYICVMRLHSYEKYNLVLHYTFEKRYLGGSESDAEDSTSADDEEDQEDGEDDQENENLITARNPLTNQETKCQVSLLFPISTCGSNEPNLSFHLPNQWDTDGMENEYQDANEGDLSLWYGGECDPTTFEMSFSLSFLIRMWNLNCEKQPKGSLVLPERDVIPVFGRAVRHLLSVPAESYFRWIGFRTYAHESQKKESDYCDAFQIPLTVFDLVNWVLQNPTTASRINYEKTPHDKRIFVDILEKIIGCKRKALIQLLPQSTMKEAHNDLVVTKGYEVSDLFSFSVGSCEERERILAKRFGRYEARRALWEKMVCEIASHIILGSNKVCHTC